MSETPNNDTLNNPIPDQLPRLEDNFDNGTSQASWEAAEELRAAYGAWLERRDIDSASTPHLTMGRREFDLFRNAPPNYLDYVFDRYEISQGDQAASMQ